jgi:hypothetical protein
MHFSLIVRAEHAETAQGVEADGTVRLTHAAYDALGGLTGAIAAEAEPAFSRLSPEAIAALPWPLRVQMRTRSPLH